MWSILYYENKPGRITRGSDYWSFGITLKNHVFGGSRRGTTYVQQGLTSQSFTNMEEASSEVLDILCRLLVGCTVISLFISFYTRG